MVHVFLRLTVCPWVGDVSCQSASLLGVTGFMRWVPGGARGRAEDKSPSPGTGRDGLKGGLRRGRGVVRAARL